MELGCLVGGVETPISEFLMLAFSAYSLELAHAGLRYTFLYAISFESPGTALCWESRPIGDTIPR
jgi:hypothetical protein